MCDTIYPAVSVGSLERDIVGEVLPVTIRLNLEEWEVLTTHLHGYVPFPMPDDTPLLNLRDRIRETIATMLVQQMQVWDYFAEEASEPGVWND